ncbi:MAG: bifunctional phosphoribosylaminoimidazolecarboxamide formyltransferase/IMP cyclohydrolase [Promicromonosporaceae bacterium]|nr:bifunctional phosphoribosylaminoimidazolecarboxamide formyltransferase/IMP cyclohydrolase [Promicromonosporaceae bacterium]
MTNIVASTAPDTQLLDDSRRPIRRALLSVFDKTGLVQLAAALHDAGVELVSTGSTAATIAEAGVPVTRVEALTGFPECLEGRVKTLHPRVHAGILADARKADHLRQLDELDIKPFDLVVVNLYPFAATLATGAPEHVLVEQIDIGGPAMVRAAAKNHPSVAVVVDPTRYNDVTAAICAGGFTYAQRKALAAEAFRHTATYDVAVASWMTAAVASDDEPLLPKWWGATYQRAEVLRYGENPHQRGAVYAAGDGSVGVAQGRVLHGKAMSYNNYQDADAAWRAAWDHAEPAVAVVKHANPCGVAVGATIAEAHARAHATDPVSAFGGVIAANGVITAEAAEQIAPIFTEVVVAPGFEPGALAVLTQKKNIRLVEVPLPPVMVSTGSTTGREALETRPISGGLLVQEADRFQADGDDPATWTLAAGSAADVATLADLAFAWRAVRAAKSNAILLASGGAAVGIGMGQVNRLDSCRLAVERANTLADGAERARGAVAASDAFFPFADGLQVLIDAGVRAVVQPGGSMRDAEVISAAEAAGVTLYLTGTRHFSH